LTAEDAKLQSLNLAILFMIADIFWVKKTRQMHGILGYKKLATEKFHSPLFFHSPSQKFHLPWGEPFIRLRSTGLSYQNLT